MLIRATITGAALLLLSSCEGGGVEGDDIDIEWQFVEELKAEPSGKFLFCRSTAALDYWQSAVRKEAA